MPGDGLVVDVAGGGRRGGGEGGQVGEQRGEKVEEEEEEQVEAGDRHQVPDRWNRRSRDSCSLL